MRKFLILFITPILLFISCSNLQKSKSDISVIPRPVELTDLGYVYKIPSDLIVYFDGSVAETEYVVEYLKNIIEKSSGEKITLKNSPASSEGIHLVINKDYDEILGDEGYKLSTDGDINITANTPNGLFYGVQTLLQLMPPEIFSDKKKDFKMTVPAVKIIDNPRYSYRGMHLDPCRHFFSVETTKKYLDYMAIHKLNTFHWHLTEDQGWRIEIKKYPKLTEIGSKRSGTLILTHDIKWADQKYDTIPVEGFYTQEEIKEIVQYAKERFINVIPEIEMPGHALAALASYPELSCAGGPFEVMKIWGVSDDVFCAGNDSVFAFLRDVIDEVCELFPYNYIHVGGDECPKVRWEECKKCQKRMKDHGLANEHELQSWFISEMEKYINSKGKTLIGWSEIMEGGIAPNAVLQSWQGVEAGVEAAKQHHKVIMSPSQYLYFDGINVDRKYALMEPIGQKYCWTTIEKTYSFEPTPDTIPADFRDYFIGAEATMWSEFISTEEHLEYMLMPRISALAEICWTPKELKDYDDFSKRLDKQYLRYDNMGANYRIPNPEMPDTVLLKDNLKIGIYNPSEVMQVRYTLDNTTPDINSNVYSDSISISESGVIKAACFNKEGRQSSVWTCIVIEDN